MKRRVATGLAAAVAVAGLGSAGMAQPSRDCIPVVVDFGEIAEAGEEVSVECVVVDEGADGTVVLEARARRLGTPPPRYDASGLLCAIDGRPETGCGDQVGDRYRYWSYWLSDDAWEHASVGPAFRAAEAAVVEGWHFIEGSGRPSDPPPAISPAEAREAAGTRATGAADAEVLSAEAEAGAEAEAEAGAPAGGGTGGLAGVAIGAALVVGIVVTGIAVARRRPRPA